jgi:hypothetical protein
MAVPGLATDAPRPYGFSTGLSVARSAGPPRVDAGKNLVAADLARSTVASEFCRQACRFSVAERALLVK